MRLVIWGLFVCGLIEVLGWGMLGDVVRLFFDLMIEFDWGVELLLVCMKFFVLVVVFVMKFEIVGGRFDVFGWFMMGIGGG